MGFFKDIGNVVKTVSGFGLMEKAADGLFGGKGGGSADPAMQAALAAVQGLDVPTAQSMQVTIQNLVNQGVLTPEQAEIVMQNPSAMEKIMVDPRFEQAQVDTLQGLDDIVNEGGLTAIDRARIANINDEQVQTERSQRAAILQNMAQRGLSGSGFELASQLSAQQGAANNAARQGVDVAALAQQRALDAMMQKANLGGQLSQQQFGQKSAVAQAKDAIDRFNATNKQNVINQNVATRNAAQATNLTNQQRIADQNVLMKNQNETRNADLKQQEYENKAKKAALLTNQYAGIANNQQQKDASKDAFTGQLLGAGVGALALLSDEREKKDIKGVPLDDMDAFMKSLRPILYKYKDPGARGASDGQNVGVTAQDVEQTPVGRTMVKKTSGGKMLDTQKGFSVILAALGALHDKMEKQARS